MSRDDRTSGIHFTKFPLAEDIVFTVVSAIIVVVAITVIFMPPVMSLAADVSVDAPSGEIGVFAVLVDSDGSPFTDAEVAVYDSNGLLLEDDKANRDGEMDLDFAGTAGTYELLLTVEVDKDVFTTHSVDVDMEPGFIYEIDYTLLPDDTIIASAVRAAGEILVFGMITDTSGGGVEGVVEVFDPDGVSVGDDKSNKDGAYDLSFVDSPGTYTVVTTVEVGKDVYSVHSQDVWMEPGSTYEIDYTLEDDDTITPGSVEVGVPPGEIGVFGGFTDTAGDPIRDGEVEVFDSDGNLVGDDKTGNDGAYWIDFEGVPDTYTVLMTYEISKGVFSTHSVDIWMEPGSTYETDFTLQDDDTITDGGTVIGVPPGNIEVYGSLVDAEGLPVKGGEIELFNSDGDRVGKKKTDGSGFFDFSFDGPSDTYTFVATVEVSPGVFVTESIDLWMERDYFYGVHLTISESDTVVIVPIPVY